MNGRKRTVGINIRVTEKEKKKIKSNAAKCKLSVSEYLRQLATGYTPKELPAEPLYEVLNKLKRIDDDYKTVLITRATRELENYLHSFREGDDDGNN